MTIMYTHRNTTLDSVNTKITKCCASTLNTGNSGHIITSESTSASNTFGGSVGWASVRREDRLACCPLLEREMGITVGHENLRMAAGLGKPYPGDPFFFVNPEMTSASCPGTPSGVLFRSRRGVVRSGG